MKTNSDETALLRTQLLRALAQHRAAPVNFPSSFMQLVARKTGPKRLQYEFEDGAWSRSADGDVNLPALGVMVDMALGGASRLASKTKHRVATVHMKMQFTGAPAAGHLITKSEFIAICARSPMYQTISRATVLSGKTIVAHADGAFALIPLAPEAVRHSLHWDRGEIARQEPLAVGTLEDHELQVLRRFDDANEIATPQLPFVEHFWCGTPIAGQRSAKLTVAFSPHLGNRSGNAHGGMLFGMAARTANAAAPAGMRLSNVCAWFVSPGHGPALHVHSTVIQAGRSFAVVRTEILGGDGKRVLEATTQHVMEPPAAS